ncbi:BESS motif,MADF domain [Cinara cedri]|uniref:BESS motif,MADF domain n=1 Tax=Cinara cedri TaxID=506608 RepID=A0A5E4NM57_9HEMI|nr:BESS motif,MADF domain [Cinara cedri]
MAAHNIDCELLIKEVQKRPSLWNSTDKNYKDKTKKNKAWCEIALSFIIDFQEKNESEQKIILQDLTSKWRTIRDNYIRYLKKQNKCKISGSATSKIRQYIYGEQLSFLRKNKESRITDSSYVKTEEDGSANFDGIEVDSVTREDDINHEITATTSNENSTNKRKKPSVEHTLIDFMNSHKAAKKTYENDEDLAFFYSLLSSVKSLTMDEKFTFRMQTMQLLQNIKKLKQSQSDNTPSINVLANVRPPSSSSTVSHHSQFSDE